MLSGSYAATALLTAVLAGTRGAEPGMGAAFLGGAGFLSELYGAALG